MFRFWDLVVGPVLDAARARRIVEIGALRGDNTRRIIERLGPDGELHVIDPLPDFDPLDHEKEFPGQYVFHRALSVDVLGDLPPMDAALIDGDHNWYTVVNELRLLRDVARRAGTPLPVLFLHDVGWPYGRRDLYYDPDTVPAEHRRPHTRAGMRLGRSELAREGGMNAGMWNADHEGGPHNGVLTALDDFTAEHDRPLRRVVLPLVFGLAIVVEQDRLEREPELGEEVRLRAVAHNHTLLGRRAARIDHLAARYLDAVVRGLVDEYYLENEVRIDHLIDAAENGRKPNHALLRDPVRAGSVTFERVRARRRTGTEKADATDLAGHALAPSGRLGLDELSSALDHAREEGATGDLAVCGTGRGGTGVFLRAYLEAHDLPGELWLADRFSAEGLGDLNAVRDAFDRFGLLDDRVRFLVGDPSATLPDAPVGDLALLCLGAFDGADTRAALDHLYPRLVDGGVVVVEDVTDPDVAAAVAGFRADHGLTEVEHRFSARGTTWTKRSDRADAASATAVAPAPGAARTPLAPRVAGGIDLSIVIVFYNMRREAERSLHALSRAYQRGIDDLDYEVIVVENGSAPEQRLGAELVAGFGPEFRYLDLGEQAKPSPAHALNRGIAESSGRSLALMVDGAHVVTPGVLRYGMAGLATYEPAIVAAQAWYLGPGQQGEAMRSGYDQAVEDQLLDNIAWPDDGYRLFEIGHIQGDRDPLEGLWESNCLFVRRAQLEQVGGFDEGFAMPGGGYTNLDLYERLAASPDVQAVTILGEGSFHQVHGGTTTNLADSEERRTRVHGYAEHYAELRGRPFIGPEKPLRYVGAFETNDAKRTKARRITGAAFEVDQAVEGDDGPLGRPRPVPEDLRDGFTDAYWRSHAWRNTTWLGQPVVNAATDLVTYQEIIAEVRPDWIIDTGTRRGERAHFFATICDLVGHGQVVGVGPRREGEERITHPRITYVNGPPQRDDVVAQVRDIVGAEANALVVLGTRGRRNRMRMEFDAYAPMVGVGSYVIVEHTMVNGWPVDGSHGPGPFETVRGILASRGDFVVDHEREKQSLTFNPYGFLRRIS